jgi:hypothetical protein
MKRPDAAALLPESPLGLPPPESPLGLPPPESPDGDGARLTPFIARRSPIPTRRGPCPRSPVPEGEAEIRATAE